MRTPQQMVDNDDGRSNPAPRHPTQHPIRYPAGDDVRRPHTYGVDFTTLADRWCCQFAIQNQTAIEAFLLSFRVF